ncbi:transposase is4 [Holotrichia oblita]|uniref:Transposase is4 n=1 Tax=Holotrichia oblita TaxID=644536 RepID=A0ACB9SM48_HOLOL|nr:transposase is4 [Holotrichia oblita]
MHPKQLFDPGNKSDAELPRELAMQSDDELSEINDSSDDEVDCVEEQLEGSDTEQEVSSGDEDNEHQHESIIFGKDLNTNWASNNPPCNVKTHSHNIVRELSGIKGIAKDAKSALDCWSAFFDNNMLNTIVYNTNKYICSKKARYSRERDCKLTDLAELKAFIGFLYSRNSVIRASVNRFLSKPCVLIEIS